MAGLLDMFNLSDDPNKNSALWQGLLSAGFGAMAGRGNTLQALGQGGLTGLAGYGNELQRQEQSKLADAREKRMGMQDQVAQLQLEELKRQQELARLPQKFMGTPEQALAGGGGPTVENAQKVGQFDQQGYLQALEGMDPLMAMEMRRKLGPKPSDFKTVGGSLVQITPDGKVSEAYRAPEKPAGSSPLGKLIEEMNALPANDPRRGVYMDAIKKATTHAPATSVSVNTGQKGFDNTLKLRGDFRSEPIYKAHQEVQSAHSQITQAIKQASPAGDLAAATKIMKILDPGSVVRESELGMAMAASGMLDRLTNYAQMRISGEKLTPTQRQDFKRLADALLGESAKAYNAKRGEYQGIADRNELNAIDVVGPESKAPAMPAASVDALVDKYRSK